MEWSSRDAAHLDQILSGRFLGQRVEQLVRIIHQLASGRLADQVSAGASIPIFFSVSMLMDSEWP